MNLQKSKIFFLIEILYMLIPMALVFSVAISELFLIIIVIFFLFHTFQYKIFFYYKNKFFIFFIFFCIYLVLVSLIKNKEVPISVLFFFRFGLFALSTWFLLDNNKNLIKFILISIFITYSIVLADATFQYFHGSNLLGYIYDITQQPRLSGFFKDELKLGSYLARLSPLIFLQLELFRNQNKTYTSLKNTMFYIFIFFYTFAIFSSGERTSFFYYLLSLFLFFISLCNLKKSFIIFLVCIIGILFSYSGGKSRLIETTILQIDGAFKNSKAEKFKLKDFDKIPIQHLHHWKSTVLMAKENIFFGVGPRMFRVECKNIKYKVPNGCATHPHSLYFQLLGEAGTIGVIFLFFLFFCILKKLIASYEKNNFFLIENKKTLSFFSLSCLFLHFFPFLPNGNFFNNWLNIITFLPMGIFLYSNQKVKS